MYSRLLVVLGFCLPPIISLIVICKFGVNVPYWDQWEYVPYFSELKEGVLTVARLFEQQLEYRQFFPNLTFVFLGYFSNWNVVWEMIFSWSLVLCTLLILFKLADISWTKINLLPVFLSFVLFHPFQIENWLSGVQLVYFMGNLAFILAIFSATLSKGSLFKTLLVGCFSTIATFSSANGPLSFLLSGFLLIYNIPRGVKLKSSITLFVIFLSAIAIYFSGYSKPVAHPDPLLILHRLDKSLLYFLSSLGRPVEGISFVLEGTEQFEWQQISSVYVSAFFGLAFLALYFENLFWWFNRALSNEKKPTLLWLTIGAYSIGTAALTTIGRIGFGVQQSLSPRYVSFSIWLPMALIVLTYLRGKNVNQTIKLGLCSVVSVALISGYLFLLPKGRQYRQARNQIKACVVFSAISDSKCVEEVVYPHREIVISRAKTLSDLGYLSPKPFTSNLLGESSAKIVSTSLLPEGNGHLDSIDFTQNGTITISGSASFPSRSSKGGKRESPDLIVVTTGSEKDKPELGRVVATAMPEQNYVWLKYAQTEQNEIRWRWSIKFQNEQKEGDAYLQVWSYDVVSNSLNQIGKQIPLNQADEALQNLFSKGSRVG